MISLKIRLLKPDAVPCIFSKSVPDNQLQSIEDDFIDDHGEFSIDENPRPSPQKEPEITLSERPDKREETKEFSVKVEDPFQTLVPEYQLESVDNDSIDDHRKFSTEDPDENPILFPQKEEEVGIDFNKTMDFSVKVEDSFSNNPWCVDDATAYLKFCCPECEYQIPDLYMFSEHALRNHIKSVVLFGHEKDNNLQIKEENLDIIERFDNYEEMETDTFLSSPQFDQYGFPSSGQEENSKCFNVNENPNIVEKCDSTPKISMNNLSRKAQNIFKESHEVLRKTEATLIKEEKVQKSKPTIEETKCDFCNFECDTIDKLNEHKVEKHQDGKNMCCSYCEFKSRGTVLLKCHIDEKHPEHGEKTNLCNFCRKGFIFKESCRIHKQTFHFKELEKHKLVIKEEKSKMAKEKTVCDICNFDYKTLDELNEHHLQKHLDGKFKLCLYCDKRFPNWLNLKCHIDRKHPEHGEKIHLCDLCGKGFIFQDSCKSHKKSQHEKAYVEKEMSKLTKQNSSNQKAVCDICNCESESLDALKGHKLEHQDGIFKCCMYCKYTNKHWNLLKIHLDRKHPQHGEKKYSCDECEKSFIFDVSCKSHKKIVHSKSEDTQQKVCHICGFSTLTQGFLNQHILKKHEKDKHKQCPHCSYHVWSYREIEVHIDGKHPELYDKQFDCYHCSKRFIFERSLKKHLDKLQLRKQLSCKLCGLKMIKIQELLDHVSEIHPEGMQNTSGAEVPFVSTDNKFKEICEFCNSEWDSLDSLKAHKIKVHQDGKFKCCFYCDYKSPIMCNLRYHIDRHHPEHGERKHLCDLCGEGFMFLQNVKKHKMDSHQKVNCHICGKECYNNASLKDHLASSHNIGGTQLNCKLCTFSTASKASLKSHIFQIHRQEKHKKCPYCEYSTGVIRRMHIHIDSKHPEHDKKNFSCDHCSRRFIFENSLKCHLENIKNGPKRKKK